MSIVTNKISLPKKVPCPQCGQACSFSSAENPFRPFCSERCQLIDLGQWANEDYRVPAETNSDIFEEIDSTESIELKNSH